jgi:hypothetical protein
MKDVRERLRKLAISTKNYLLELKNERKPDFLFLERRARAKVDRTCDKDDVL